ncbi:MAG: hypothetical protein AAFV80_07670 [Bacteroidota bacterium]
MFIIPFRIRVILMISLLALGIVISFLPRGMAWSWLFYVPGLILLIGYVLFGTIGPASKALQAGDFDKAEDLLNKTWKPNWMIKFNRGTYYFIRGTLATQRKQFSEAEDFMKTALDIGLPSDDFTGQIYLVLAQITAGKGKKTQAKNYIREAKKLNIKEPVVAQAIKDVEKQLKMIPKNQQAHSHYRHKMGKGGRRIR